MVKVAHRYGPQTRPSAQGLGYFNVSYNPNQFGAALGQAIGSFGSALEVAQERRQENQRFDTLIDFTEFETSAKLEIERLKQDTPENAANFLEQAEAVYTNAQSNFLNRVPPEQQKEFEYRAGQIKQGVIYDAFKFDFEQQNLFFSNKINDTLRQAQVKLAQAPGNLDAERASIMEVIDASGLTPMEKERQKRIANAALESISYKSSIKTARQAQLRGTDGIANKQLPAEAAGILGAIAKRESGGKYDIQYDGGSGSRIKSFADHPRSHATITGGPNKGQRSSASGRYQFIETTWDAAAAGAGVRDFSPESQDAAAWYWAQKTFADYTGRRKSLTQAIRDNDWGIIRSALGSQWEGVKHMSDKEFAETFQANSGIYTDLSNVRNDERFSNIPFDQRQALERDAFAEADGEYAELLKQQRAAEEARINSLYVALNDGTAGMADIMSLRSEGILRDYDDINKAQTILEKRIGDQRWATEGEAKLTSGGVWVGGDEDDRKRANALFGADGRSALEGWSAEYVDQTLLPRYEKMQMAAPDMANLLQSMATGLNSQQAAFAFETLRRMRETAPESFVAQFPEEIQRKLDNWELRRNYYQPEDLVGQIQNRGADQASRQAQSLLRADAKELAKELTLEEIQPVFESIIPWQSANVPITARGKTVLEREFRALFTDAYVEAGGDAEVAQQLAEKRIARVWSLTEIGGKPMITKFPPEVAGYKKHNGSYAWIDKAVRTELGLDRGQEFELIADETTEQEIIKFRRGQNDPDAVLQRPSYFVAYKDADGLTRLAVDADGTPLRIDFEVDKETLREEEEAFRAKQEQADEDYIITKYRQAEQAYRFSRTPIPSDLQRSYDEVIEDRKQRGTSQYLQELDELGNNLIQMREMAPVR